MADKPAASEKAPASTKIALASLLISVCSIGLTFYVWWSSFGEDSIRQATEYSKVHSTDKAAAGDRRVFLWHVFERSLEIGGRKRKWETNLVKSDGLGIMRHMLRMEYLSQLINQQRINPDFLSPDIRCEIGATAAYVSVYGAGDPKINKLERQELRSFNYSGRDTEGLNWLNGDCKVLLLDDDGALVADAPKAAD